MKRLAFGFAVFGSLYFSALAFAGEDKVELKLVKYDALTKLITSHKGKIVVVDFWADT
jgi:hypothetical protein